MQIRNWKFIFAVMLLLKVPSLALGQNDPSSPNDQQTEESYANAERDVADQDRALSSWKTEKQGTFTIHSPPVGNTKVISYQGDVETETANNTEAFSRLVAVAESACPGFNKREFVTKLFGAGSIVSSEASKDFCLFESSRSAKAITKNGGPFITFNESPLVFVLLLKPSSDVDLANSNVSMRNLSKRILQKLTPAIYLGGTSQGSISDDNSAANNPDNAGAANILSSQSSLSPTSLKAAIDAIPRANHPIGMAMKEGEWDSYNMMVEYTNMVLFPGGVAIPATCRNWNPQKPIGPNMGCSITRYTLSNGRVKFTGDKEPADLSDFNGFAPGKSVSIDVGNVGGGGASTYGGSISQVSGGELKMTPSGDISSGDWVSNSIQGGNYSGYAGSNAAGVTGKYYLDGYLIAVQDRNGQISIGFIGQKTEGRNIYTFMNGEQYWK